MPRGQKRQGPRTRSGTRILFPFLGDTISKRTLEAALRLAEVDDATLVPVYIASVPLSLPLDAQLPAESSVALPLLETIEQRATKQGVPVDSRIETGRTPRHALEQLFAEERFDRVVISAATKVSEGFEPEDMAWLLDHAPGEVVIISPRSD
jgi:nucleotide-binding universal stress UspA family protein